MYNNGHLGLNDFFALARRGTAVFSASYAQEVGRPNAKWDSSNRAVASKYEIFSHLLLQFTAILTNHQVTVCSLSEGEYGVWKRRDKVYRPGAMGMMTSEPQFTVQSTDGRGVEHVCRPFEDQAGSLVLFNEEGLHYTSDKLRTGECGMPLGAALLGRLQSLGLRLVFIHHQPGCLFPSVDPADEPTAGVHHLLSVEGFESGQIITYSTANRSETYSAGNCSTYSSFPIKTNTEYLKVLPFAPAVHEEVSATAMGCSDPGDCIDGILSGTWEDVRRTLGACGVNSNRPLRGPVREKASGLIAIQREALLGLMACDPSGVLPLLTSCLAKKLADKVRHQADMDTARAQVQVPADLVRHQADMDTACAQVHVLTSVLRDICVYARSCIGSRRRCGGEVEEVVGTTMSGIGSGGSISGSMGQITQVQLLVGTARTEICLGDFLARSAWRSEDYVVDEYGGAKGDAVLALFGSPGAAEEA
jgi:hypothetical protein